MGSPAAAASKALDPLLARPPTPPRERQIDLDPKLSLSRNPLVSHLTLQTPPGHSPASGLSTNGSSRRSTKRVEFSVPDERRDPLAHTDKENEHLKSTPISAPSPYGSFKPLRSILKHTSSPIPPNPLDPTATDGDVANGLTLATMLESTIKHLAGNDRNSKVDAYTMLVRALKASKNLPDRIALQSKMSLFMQFIQRDITVRGENGAMDSSMINHALTLLATFLHFPAIASTLTPDFGVFVVDHCIRSFEDPATPKDVARHLMQVIVYQDFPPKVMTADRVGRLVSSLHNIEEHIKGKSIIMSRILIYRRLIQQSTLHMVAHSDWLYDLFTDMLSSVKDIRAAAINVGLEASFTSGREKQLSKKVMEILQMSADETPYIEYYIQRLTTMSKEKSEAAAVPQIWSVVVLLLRCPMDRWEYFNRWLEIIQRCFNSSDYQTKLEANYAWNRLVYISHFYESSFSKSLMILCQPFSQLTRKSKQPDELRKAIIGGVCNLYYYAFKPNSGSIRIDQYWDACVHKLMRTLIIPGSDGKPIEKQRLSTFDGPAQAADILAGLFDPSNMRLWKEDRIAESTLIKPMELPALDPKWIRRNFARVFSVVEPIISKSFLDLADPGSSASKLWRSLIGAVAIAASKEVKVAMDTAAFLGHAISVLKRIWVTGPDETTITHDGQRLFLKATEFYLNTMILSIGHLPFTEKLLFLKDETLIPAATPSRRSTKVHGLMQSLLYHLFSILSFLPTGISDGDEVTSLVKAIFEPFMLTRSLRGKKDLAQELLQAPLLQDRPTTTGPWIFISEVLSIPEEQSQSASSADSTSISPRGHEFRILVKHLDRGIGYGPNLPWPHWLSLFHFAVEQAIEVSGESGCAVAVIEPLAKAVLERLPAGSNSLDHILYEVGVQLVCNARQPRDRQALEAAKRRLWGTAVAVAGSISFDPFNNLYRLTSHLLEVLYGTAHNVEENVVASLIAETSHFLSRSNKTLAFKSLVQLQQGLGLWVQDADERYGSKQLTIVSQAVKLMWDQICNLLASSLENSQLTAIQDLLCCAFKSKHRHIVNTMILLWNRSFEHANIIEYPEALKDILLSLRVHTDVVLPGLDVPAIGANNSLPILIDSQDDMDTTTSVDKSNQQIGFRSNLPSSPSNIASLKSRKTPESSRINTRGHEDQPHSGSSRMTRSAKRNQTLKLRHDNSQIQFTSIEMLSPSNRRKESQALTDRQKEVRERQFENAALFSSIQSGSENEKAQTFPAAHQASPLRTGTIKLHTGDESVTPKATRSYDYVSSTPTPRRGQHLMIDEDQMTDDIPSSPPEPRRNLLPKMKTHARDTRMLDEIPMSSSPVSQSPVSKIILIPKREQLELRDDIVHIASESVFDEHTASPDINREPSVDLGLDAVQDGSVVKSSALVPDNMAELPPLNHKTVPTSSSKTLADMLRTSVAQLISNPGSAAVSHKLHEAEVDLKDRSFEMSDSEEHSMARLGIELDSRKCDPIPAYGTPSPEKNQTTKDVIEGDTIYLKAEDDSSDDSRSSQTKLRKRKRGLDKDRNTGGKRRKHIVERDTIRSTVIVECQVPENAPQTNGVEPTDIDEATTEEEMSEGASFINAQDASDLSQHPGDETILGRPHFDEDGMDSDTAAVNLQLITEASQQSEVDIFTPSADDFVSESIIVVESEAIVLCDEKTATVAKAAPSSMQAADQDTTPAAQSAMESIMTSLRNGLEGLRTAKLSREDVYKIEDMFMDIKKELYDAERRSRR